VTTLATVVRLELIGASRLKWIRLLTAAFALLAAAAAYSAGAADQLSGADGFARTTLALVPVVLLLVPLAAVILGISGQCAEPGGEPFLFAQPVGRATIVIGRWAGEALALGGAIVIGLAIGGWIVVWSNGADGLLSFAFFVAASVLLGWIFLSLAAAIAAATERRVTALGIGIFTWFLCVLLYDGVALSLASWATGSIGGRVLLLSVLGNPADLTRIAMLLISGTPNVLGAAGEAWTRFLGGGRTAAVLVTGVLLMWTIAPLGVAARIVRSRDL